METMQAWQVRLLRAHAPALENPKRRYKLNIIVLIRCEHRMAALPSGLDARDTVSVG